MKKLVVVFLAVFASSALAQKPAPNEHARWQREAARITIVRDDRGIAHIRGNTDADAVFGMIYAQAEDDFNRVETNYLNSIGRLAEAEGEKAIWSDLRQKLFINTDTMKALYSKSPPWLKTLMNAWADGLNYYLLKHPGVKPRVITHFEPWMALTFSEGSIGGDIESVNLREVQAFYGDDPESKVTNEEDLLPSHEPEPRGSNGMAIAPSNTANHHALLLINPHTSFFFRSELQMTSNQGLNAYGAVTWGQFFIYQGFNDRLGWMHTSSGVDAIDEYLETIVKKGNRFYYKYGTAERPVTVSTIVIPYATGSGIAKKTFTVYHTHHGPIVRELNGKWVAVRLMNKPLEALQQSYIRTKARNYQQFVKPMALHANSSNNTIYADADGNIAYFHANFIPRRDARFDWTKPVDGSDPATEWGPLLSVEESPHLFNPSVGWLYNSNDAPWWAAGKDSPRKDAFPAYVEKGGSSPRGRHAVLVLENKKDFTIESLRAAAYDSYLTFFAETIPSLLKAYDALPASDSLKSQLAEQIDVLRAWDYRWAVNSIPTSLAVYWGEALGPLGATATAAQQLDALRTGSRRLSADFGTWKTPWGEINRFQRLTGDIVQPFNDAGPSIPVGFTSARWGSLASFGARQYPNTKKWYGTSGNSFVSVVEFGDSVRAIAVTAGGESGHPDSPHFNDQAERYATGNLRAVYFYPSQLKGHVERTYHP